MEFLDRCEELDRLSRLVETGGLAVVSGRRRIGKTRLLIEWCRRHGGLYTVSDQSAPSIQRRYLASDIGTRLPGFDSVEYPDWRSLLKRLAADAASVRFRGPVVFDEFPYLVASSPELPSVLQAWVDHEVKKTGLSFAIAGSSQKMMHGLVTGASEPLYGRARETLALRPLSPGFLPEALGLHSPADAVLAYTAWGGVPHYWELAEPAGPDVDRAVAEIVLNPLGPLHDEPDRLLLEELPPALALRPILDAIGLGANRLSEIAGRVGQPSTALSRPMARLLDLGLVKREVPFGTPSKNAKRSLYRIADPFFRMWFRVVAPHRGVMAEAPAGTRLSLWRAAKPRLAAEAWEDLARAWISAEHGGPAALAASGPWQPAGRFWQGGEPEWDIVSLSLDGRRALLGEVKWLSRPAEREEIEQWVRALRSKGVPRIEAFRDASVHHALFVPEVRKGVRAEVEGVAVITAARVISDLR